VRHENKEKIAEFSMARKSTFQEGRRGGQGNLINQEEKVKVFSKRKGHGKFKEREEIDIMRSRLGHEGMPAHGKFSTNTVLGGWRSLSKHFN